jgi:adenine-specific DNA methylase
LIEEWLPIAEIGIESLRERTPMTPYPAPNRLHVWWARRPLIASRAAVLASLLPADADRAKLLHVLGIHGNPIVAKAAIENAKRSGKRVENPYTYKRAFFYTPDDDELSWLIENASRVGVRSISVLDPTAGGGSIPLESSRLGTHVVGNELNPVAWLVLKATVEFPTRFGSDLLRRYQRLACEWRSRIQDRIAGFFPKDPDPSKENATYLWARTVTCPYCGGLVPLSPNWRLDGKGTGLRIVPHTDDPKHRHCTFEIVTKTKDQSPGTVKQGDGLCPYADCRRVIDDDEIKNQALNGKMGEQLYAVIYKQTAKIGTTKSGKDKIKNLRGFRAPLPEDSVWQQVNAAIELKRPEWLARNIWPEERFLDCYRRNMRDCIDQYGFNYWTEFFSPRQLLVHCTSIEVFQELLSEIRDQHAGQIPEVDQAALTYLALAIDKQVDWNSTFSTWEVSKQRMAHTFAQHSYSYKMSYCEMSPTIAGVGLDWVTSATGDALEELIELTNRDPLDRFFRANLKNGDVKITLGSADSLGVADASINCIVIDPPYYNNVSYSELSDFFYVWLKRTAGLLYPDEFASYLTDKDHEAIANPFRFRGQKQALRLAGRDYQQRMAAIFTECRRVIKPHGVMTVMFTHKASGAWDALATGLVNAGFVITASWPINTEAEGSLHIKEKSAAKSTIFLVCRPREEKVDGTGKAYWEEVEPLVQEAVRKRVAEFQEAGISGVDLYLASFGPALQVFSENWPLKRGRPVQKPRDLPLFPDEEFDPYAVWPEDALDAARREVKRWRMDQLATVKRKHHLDPLTEWFVLAWDAFKAPRFPVDEALKLAKVVGLDFDQEVKGVICEVKSSDVVLWDSKIRRAKGKLGPMGESCMLNTLQQAATIVRERNTGAARSAIEEGGLLEDQTLMTALEAMLNVLPAVSAPEGVKVLKSTIGGAAGDWYALEQLRRLAFAEQVPEPKQQLLPFAEMTDAEDEESEDTEE